MRWAIRRQPRYVCACVAAPTVAVVLPIARSPPLIGSARRLQLLVQLRPAHWFAAHMHCKFSAQVNHALPSGSDGAGPRSTAFMALDKCLPGRDFLHVIDIGPPLAEGTVAQLEYDAEWLAILRATESLMSYGRAPARLPRQPLDVSVTQPSTPMCIPRNFQQTVPAYTPPQLASGVRRHGGVATAVPNPQTRAFCDMLGIPDPTQRGLVPAPWTASMNPDEIALDDMSARETGSAAQTTNPDEISLD